MEADAVGAEIGEPVHGVDRVERRPHLGAEGVTARVPDGPEPEGEMVFRPGGEGIGHGPPVVVARCSGRVDGRALSQAEAEDSVIGDRSLPTPEGIHASSRHPLPPAGGRRRRRRREPTMIRWGIIGPGSIATGFAEAMQWAEGGSITAVASRSSERAEAFGDRFDIPTRYGDYDALAADPDVDVVYVATPHSRHEVDTVDFLQAGKHVLCEKPFALNARQAARMVEEARSRGLFLMEAIWSRFLPAYRSLVDVIGAGRIGEPQLVEADFGFRRPVDPAHRHFARDLGGGALLDLGIYPIQLCTLVLGPIEHVVSDGAVGDTGVDEGVTAFLR